MKGEEFRPITKYEGRYEVSNLGRVRSLPRDVWNSRGFYMPIKGRILRQYGTVRTNHLRVYLYENDNRICYFVHRLLGIEFIPNPENLPFINHKDEDPTNNYINNLEWCTMLYNNNFGTTKERSARGHWIKVVQLSLDGKLIKVWNSIKEAKSQFKEIDAHGIGDCCKGKHKSLHGYQWMHYTDYINNGASRYKDNKTIEVVQLSLNGDYIKTWESAAQAVKELKFKSNHICECCGKQEKYKTFKGFIWMYQHDYENLKINKSA